VSVVWAASYIWVKQMACDGFHQPKWLVHGRVGRVGVLEDWKTSLGLKVTHRDGEVIPSAAYAG
jgi:hypothetical protein